MKFFVQSYSIGECLPEGKDRRLAAIEHRISELIASNFSSNLQDNIWLEDHLKGLGIDLLFVGKQIKVAQIQRRAKALKVVVLANSNVDVLGAKSGIKRGTD